MNKVNTFQKLDNIFGIEQEQPTNDVVVVEAAPLPVPVAQEQEEDFPSLNDLHDDFQLARQSLRNLLDKGETVVDNMLTIAAQTESARSFEVAGNLIKTMSDVAKDLVALHKTTNEARKKKDDNGPATTKIIKNTQNNVVFQGTTTDLFDMLENGDKE